MKSLLRSLAVVLSLTLTAGAIGDDDKPRQNDAFGDLLRIGMGAANSKQSDKDREKREKEEKKKTKDAKQEEERLLAPAEEILLGHTMSNSLFDIAGRRVADEPLQRYVNLVGRSVALQSPRGDAMYGFSVTDSQAASTFALPGGWIVITTGMMKNVEDESELAALLAREISHVASRDLERQLQSHNSFKKLSPQATPEERELAAIAVADAGVQLLLGTGLPKRTELAADEGAVRLLAATGYDATALSRVLDRAYARKLSGTIRRGSGLGDRSAVMRAIIEGEAAGLEGAQNHERFRTATAGIRAASK